MSARNLYFTQLQALGHMSRHGLALGVDQLHLSNQCRIGSGREWIGRGTRGKFSQSGQILLGLLATIRQTQENEEGGAAAKKIVVA